MCQLEGSDHGGRDSAAELALAGIDVQTSDGSCNRLTLGPAPSDATNYTPPKQTVNAFVPLCAKPVTIKVCRTIIKDIEPTDLDHGTGFTREG